MKVLVVGSSIAGPFTAYWLWRAGADVTVIERYPEPRRGGQNIDIRAVGVTVIRRLPGLEPAVRRNLHILEALRLVDGEGRPIATMTTTGDPDAQFIMSEYEIFRDRLSDVLCELSQGKSSVRFIYNEQISALRQDSGGGGQTTVDFVNGTATQDFDLVVACDGATSRTRAMGFTCGVRDHVVPVHCWAAYFTVSTDFLEGSKIGHAISAVGGRFISLGPDPDTKGNRAMLMSIHRPADSKSMDEFRSASRAGESAIKQHAIQRFSGAGWLSEQILEAMLESEDFYASEIVQVKVPELFRGRLVLVGDAGYCPGPTGMGTSLALVGGYILAGEMTRHDGNIDAALRAYENRMKPMVTEYQKIPPGVPAFMAPQTSRGIWLRNMVFKLVCWGMSLGSWFSWLGKYWVAAFGAGDKFDIPEYDWSRHEDRTVMGN